MAYLTTNLLERTTLRLLQGRRYGLIGRNGIGKSTLLRRIATGTLPGFPPHIRVSQVLQDLPQVEDPTLTPVQYLIKFDPDRCEVEKRISEIEATECPEEEMETQANMLSSLYDMLEDEGTANVRAVKILKDLGFRYSICLSPGTLVHRFHKLPSV
jgi:ATPase subunit of ABC transporter with duplicated ATPase domains